MKSFISPATPFADDYGYERFLTLRDVERLTSLRKSTIYALIQRGEFPKPVTITARRVAWVSSEIQAWIAVRVGEAV